MFGGFVFAFHIELAMVAFSCSFLCVHSKQKGLSEMLGFYAATSTRNSLQRAFLGCSWNIDKMVVSVPYVLRSPNTKCPDRLWLCCPTWKKNTDLLVSLCRIQHNGMCMHSCSFLRRCTPVPGLNSCPHIAYGY